MSAIEPVIRYQRTRFRGGSASSPGTPRYEQGLQQKEDALQRLVDVWASGEAGAALGFAAARLFDEFDPLEREKERVLADRGVTGGRAQMKLFKELEKSALEYLALAQQPAVPADEARLRERYAAQVLPELMKELGFKNPMQVPKLDKIVVNMGLGEAINNGKIIDASVEQLAAITGQRPVVTKSRKSIANFKLRQGQSVGAMVTLRGERAYEFLDRLVSIALPRVRDFKGISDRSFDGRGNYSLGLREQIIFPEIQVDKVEKTRGMTVSMITTAKTDQEGRRLLKLLGMPFAS